MGFLFDALGLVPWVNIGGRVEAQNSTFSEYGHVAYQIQGNNVYSNMVANMCCHIQEFHKNRLNLSLKLPPPPWQV